MLLQLVRFGTYNGQGKEKPISSPEVLQSLLPHAVALALRYGLSCDAVSAALAPDSSFSRGHRALHDDKVELKEIKQHLRALNAVLSPNRDEDAKDDGDDATADDDQDDDQDDEEDDEDGDDDEMNC